MLLIIVTTMTASPQASAQEALDEAYFKFYYEHAWQFDTLKTNDTREDLIILQVGPKVSKSYSYYTLQSDSLTATPDGKQVRRKIYNQVAKATVEKRELPTNFIRKRMKTVVYKNHPEGQMTVTDGISSDYYQYTDELHAQQWQVTDSTKTILDHPCQMAISDFRGRRWIAWFAPDIPIGDGPWKFSGLPGLIMEVYDTENHYHFTMVAIESVADEPIVFTPVVLSATTFGTYEKTTRIGFLRGLFRYQWNQSAYMNAELGIPTFDENSASSKQFNLKERDLW